MMDCQNNDPCAGEYVNTGRCADGADVSTSRRKCDPCDGYAYHGDVSPADDCDLAANGGSCDM